MSARGCNGKRPHLSRGEGERLGRTGRGGAVVLGLCFCASCFERPAEKPQATAIPERGASVLVESSAAEFRTGTVLGSERDTLRVQWSRDGEVMRVRPEDTYALPPLSTPVVGGFAICELSAGNWAGCRVLGQLGPQLRVSDAEGREHRLDSPQVVPPTAVTELNLQRYFERVGLLRAFADAVRAAGAPRAPVGYRPQSRRQVLAWRGGHWYDARVIDVERHQVTLRWESDQTEGVVPLDAVVPPPPSCGFPEKGRYALLRPSGPSSPWIPVLVTQISTVEAQVKDERQELRAVLARDLCALQPR